MRFIVLIPSDSYRTNAGARIRYARIATVLDRRGHQLVLEEIEAFQPHTEVCDVVIISKCHDARSLIAARVLRTRGVRVGIDLFDDYFSQRDDSRLVRFRDWLAALVPSLDFILCSTPVMAQVARKYDARLPVHVMNDPMPALDMGNWSRRLAHKLASARDQRMIDLCWFGMGDNPHFQVGLSDLAAFSAQFAPPAGSDYKLRLHVLTNRRALDVDGLAMIARLPLDVTIAEWSTAAEAEALADATACVIPVNGQQFSTAKSLNRAVTAFSAGCQVVTFGYPLYSPFADLTYPDLAALIQDVGSGTARLDASSTGRLAALLEEWASPEREAEQLCNFLRTCIENEPQNDHPSSMPMAVIHGHVTSGPVHKFAQRAGALAVRSPFSRAKLGYDVLFGGRIGQQSLTMFVTEKTLAKLQPDARASARKAGQLHDRPVWAVGAHGESAETSWSEIPLAVQMMLFPKAIDDMRRQLDAAFGPMAIIVSELSRHPFSVQTA